MGVGGRDFKKEDDDLEDIHDELGIDTEDDSDTGNLPRGFNYFPVDNNDDDEEDDDDNDQNIESDSYDEDEDDADFEDEDEDDDEKDHDFSSSDDEDSSSLSSVSSASVVNDEDDIPSDTSSVKSLGAGREVTDEDDLIKKIKKAKNIKKQQPPNIINDEIVTSISFSPADDVIAVGTMEGDICL